MAGGAEGAVLFYRRTMRQRDNVTAVSYTHLIIKGLPQCLRQMDRYGITENVTVEQLLELVQTEAE